MLRNLVLVADPNSGTIASLLPVLSKLGLHPVPARDGLEALRLVDRERPLLVIAEMTLDVVNGTALCARLRGEEDTRTLPIVLMGSGDDREGRLSALQSGADEFLSKPIDPEDARLRLETLLRRSGHLQGTDGEARPEGRSAAAGPGPAHVFYQDLVEIVNGVLAQARRGEVVALGSVGPAAETLVERFSEIVGLSLAKREATDLGAHHVNVAIIGLAVGRELELSVAELHRYAFLGLVHDLGMARVPDEIVNAARGLSPEEWRFIQEHPRHTHELLKAAGREDIGEIAYQEHEREKGQGYPRGLRGNEIHPLAKILGVADVYEACTHPRVYNKTFIPYDALQLLIEMREEYFPSRFIKALMNALTVYPIGSYVQLNTGEIGRVRSTSRKNLMRPVVELFWGARGMGLSPTKVVDLSESPFLCVAAPLYEDQLPERPIGSPMPA